jgi:hypothetical protein
MGKSLADFESSTAGKNMLTGPNGIPGQCVGYMRLYIDQVLDLPQPSGKAGAKDQYLQYNNDPNLKQNFKQIGPNDNLMPGDIVFWNAKRNNPYGHVAICIDQSPAGYPFSVVEQNVIPNTVGERANIKRDQYFLGALRPNDAVPGQKISIKSLGLLKSASSNLIQKLNKFLGENMIDEFIAYSENIKPLREKLQEDSLNKKLLRAGYENNIKISSLLIECIPHIAENNLDILYEDISKFQNYEKKLLESSFLIQNNPLAKNNNQETSSETSSEASPAAQQANELSNGRQKTILKNKIIADLKNYLETKPRPDKRQVERVKAQILQLLNVANEQNTTQQQPMQQPAQPIQPQISNKTQYNLTNIVQKSIPYGFWGGSNDKLKNKVTEIIMKAYSQGDNNVESLLQKVKQGIGMTGLGSRSDLYNRLRLNLNKAMSSGLI